MIRNQVIDILMNRKSARTYKKRKPSREVIETVVRAGQQAPFASQLYSVIYSTEGRLPFNAPLWFVICVDAHRLELFMRRRGWSVRTNDVTLLLLAMQDASYMAENMVTAAESLGMGSCFIGEGSISAARVRNLARKLRLPPRVLPIVELAMGWPAEDCPPRPRFPLSFTLFKDAYPELDEQAVDDAMKAMDDGYLAQDYYRRQRAKIRVEEEGRADGFTYDTYSWTEHISRKWGQWMPSPNDMLDALRERGFSLERKDDNGAEGR
jgi:FMN reductase (NADPH)